MHTAELLNTFAVRGSDASFAVPTTTTQKFFKNATFTTNARFAKALTLCRCTVDSKSVGEDVFSVTPSNKSDVDYLGESTKGDLNVKLEHLEAFGNNFKLFLPLLVPSFLFTLVSNFFFVAACAFGWLGV